MCSNTDLKNRKFKHLRGVKGSLEELRRRFVYPMPDRCPYIGQALQYSSNSTGGKKCQLFKCFLRKEMYLTCS